MMSGLVRELAHRHKAMTAARKREAQNINRGVLNGFCYNQQPKLKLIIL
jgi:hypothetical protein